MVKYNERFYINTKGEKIIVSSISFEQGVANYDVKLVEENYKELRDITEEQLDNLLN